MEEATTSFGLRGGDGSRGAGGKFRKPAVRKPSSTPYDRPPPTSTAAAPASHSLAVRRRDGGWLSKLVDPAYRLISGGATRMFPSFFSRDHSDGATEASDPQDHDPKQDASVDTHKCAQNLGISRSTGVTGAGNEADRSKRASELDDHEEGKEGSYCNDDRLCEIEQMLKGKKFTREELNRLTEILHSKVSDLSNVNTGNKIASTDARAQAEGIVKSQGILRMTVEEKKQEDLSEPMWRASTPAPPSIEVGASPIDIARAYMGSRTPDVGICPKSIMSKDDKALPRTNEFALNPYAPSPLLPKPSMCWPGAVVQDQGGYMTPQSQRGRFGLHNFPRTPYSRTINSKSKTKLDSGMYSDIPSTPLQQLRTPTFELTKSRGNALNGSLGPIRRGRQRFGSETPRGPVSFPSPRNGPLQVRNSNISGNLLPSVKNNLELRATSSASKFQSVDRCLPCSPEVGVSNTAWMSEQLNRHKPTPKEKVAELDLAVRGKKSTGSEEHVDLVQSGGASDSYKTAGLIVDREVSAQVNRDTGNSTSKAGESFGADVVFGGVADAHVYGGNAGPSLDFTKASSSQFNDTNQMTMGAVDSGRQKDQCHPSRPLLHCQSNGKVASKMVPNADSCNFQNRQSKLPPPSSRSKRGLGSISINKPDLRPTVSSDSNSGGFTFPVAASSNIISDLPTPSVMPSFSAAGTHQTDPSYSFGTKRSESSLVFSFPSTSSPTTDDDASDIVFKFGSDKKSRVSFSLEGKNGICS